MNVFKEFEDRFHTEKKSISAIYLQKKLHRRGRYFLIHLSNLMNSYNQN